MNENQVIHGDAAEVIEAMEENSVDLVVTDPPYGISYESHEGSEEYRDRVHGVDWDDEFDFSKYWEDIFDLMKENTDALVFGRWENYEQMKNLQGFKQVLIWDKNTNGMGDLKAFGWSYELIFYFKKGRRPLNKRRSSVIKNDSLSSWKNGNPKDNYKHPTQKPVDLLKKLIKTCSNPNDLVFDPFCGSGSTLVAAKQLGRNFIGVDLEKKYVDVARQRIKTQSERLDSFV